MDSQEVVDEVDKGFAIDLAGMWIHTYISTCSMFVVDIVYYLLLYYVWCYLLLYVVCYV